TAPGSAAPALPRRPRPEPAVPPAAIAPSPTPRFPSRCQRYASRGRTGPRRPVDSATWAQPRRPRPRTPHPGGARAGGTRPWPRPAAFPVNGGKPTTLPPMHRLLITLPLLAAPVGAAGAAEPRADWHV